MVEHGNYTSARHLCHDEDNRSLIIRENIEISIICTVSLLVPYKRLRKLCVSDLNVMLYIITQFKLYVNILF